jgi:hypothetical protein
VVPQRCAIIAQQHYNNMKTKVIVHACVEWLIEAYYNLREFLVLLYISHYTLLSLQKFRLAGIKHIIDMKIIPYLYC